MSKQRLRVGIIGLQPERSWAASAHLPALRALSDRFDIVGVANRSRASAEAAVTACGLPRVFADATELVSSPDVDIVTVTVRVPHHFGLVSAALQAGKHVYCEWPLGNGLTQAEHLAQLAHQAEVVAVVGTQARVAPEIMYLRQLITNGYVGEVLSTTLHGWGRSRGPTIESTTTTGYLLDAANGATLLTIPVGHTLAALRDVLGDVSTVSSIIAHRRTQVRTLDTDEAVPLTAPDQVLAIGQLASGAPWSLHYQGGLPRGTSGLVWDIHGSDGDIRVTGNPSGHTQMITLTLLGARGDSRTLQPLDVPAQYSLDGPQEVIPGNVARLYGRMANDVQHGTSTAPTFDDAVALHRLIAAIETATDRGIPRSRTRQRQSNHRPVSDLGFRTSSSA